MQPNIFVLLAVAAVKFSAPTKLANPYPALGMSGISGLSGLLILPPSLFRPQQQRL
jgi:hypothetical protein